MQGDKEYTADKVLRLDQDRHVVARFVYRPGYDDMDLVTDLGYFLVAIGENANVTDVWDLAYDRGEFSLNEFYERTYTGNGIPDAAEFALLEAVLQDLHLDLSAQGGVASEFSWEDYNANLAQAQADLPGVDAHVVRAVAAYMTLGYYKATCMVCAEVEEHFGVELDPFNYERMCARYFRADKDADVDGDRNVEE